MAAKLAAPTVAEGCNKVYYASAAQDCRPHETACAEGLKQSPRSITMLRSLFCDEGVQVPSTSGAARDLQGACNHFGSCIKQALLSSRCESTSLGAGYEKFASTQTAVCMDKPAAQPCIDERKESYLKALRNEGKLAVGADWSASQTCDCYRDYVFGSAHSTQMHSSLVGSGGSYSGSMYNSPVSNGGSYSTGGSYSGARR